MSTFTYTGPESYFQHLSKDRAKGSAVFQIERNSRRLLASQEELHELGLRMEGTLSDMHEDIGRTLVEGVDILISQVEDLNATAIRMTSLIEWGFQQTLNELGSLNCTASEILQTAKTPSQTWAYEQCAIAQEASQKGLYEEAMIHIDRAISGFEGQPGYPLGQMFHILRGTLLLGSFENHDPKMVNPSAAEAAFCKAAQCADCNVERGQALLLASWGAYCGGNVAKAAEHAEAALEAHPVNLEPMFLLAKYRAHLGHGGEAYHLLKELSRWEEGYLVRACSDADFHQDGESLERFLSTYRAELVNEFAMKWQSLQELMEKTKELKSKAVRCDAVKVIDLDPDFSDEPLGQFAPPNADNAELTALHLLASVEAAEEAERRLHFKQLLIVGHQIHEAQQEANELEERILRCPAGFFADKAHKQASLRRKLQPKLDELNNLMAPLRDVEKKILSRCLRPGEKCFPKKGAISVFFVTKVLKDSIEASVRFFSGVRTFPDSGCQGIDYCALGDGDTIRRAHLRDPIETIRVGDMIPLTQKEDGWGNGEYFSNLLVFDGTMPIGNEKSYGGGSCMED